MTDGFGVGPAHEVYFNPPPNWPLPSDWEPPPGWQPDPAWGPLPNGWQLWIDEHGNPAPWPGGWAQPPYGQSPHAQAPGRPPYGHAAYGPGVHGQPTYGAPGYGGYPPQHPGYAGYPGYPTGYPAAPSTEGTAIAALILAVASFMVCPVVPAVIALVLANTASRNIAMSGGWKSGEGMVTASRIVAWINIAVSALMLIGVVLALRSPGVIGD